MMHQIRGGCETPARFPQSNRLFVLVNFQQRRAVLQSHVPDKVTPILVDDALTLTGLEFSYGVHNCRHAAATRV
jgi:hypothetical protein